MQLKRDEINNISEINQLLHLLATCLENEPNTPFSAYPNVDFVYDLANAIYAYCGFRHIVGRYSDQPIVLLNDDMIIRKFIDRKTMLSLVCLLAIKHTDNQLAEHITREFFAKSLKDALIELTINSQERIYSPYKNETLKTHSSDPIKYKTPSSDTTYNFFKRHPELKINDSLKDWKEALSHYNIKNTDPIYTNLYDNSIAIDFCRFVIPILELAFDEHGIYYDCSAAIRMRRLDDQQRALLIKLHEACSVSRLRTVHLVHWLRYNPDALPAPAVAAAHQDQSVTNQLLSYAERFVDFHVVDVRTLALRKLIDSNQWDKIIHIPQDVSVFDEIPRHIFDGIIIQKIWMTPNAEDPQNRKMCYLIEVSKKILAQLESANQNTRPGQ